MKLQKLYQFYIPTQVKTQTKTTTAKDLLVAHLFNDFKNFKKKKK